jgi:hypothetical protein
LRSAAIISVLRRPTFLTWGGFLALTVAIVSNALLLQPGRHPAPLFVTRGGEKPEPARSAAIDRPAQVPQPRPAAPSAPDPRVAAVQNALAKAAYGQLKADGYFGPQTRDAILRFQQDHGLPATGEISDALMVELRAVGALDAQ